MQDDSSALPAEVEGAEEAVITKDEIERAAQEFRSSILDADTLLLEDEDGRKELLIFNGDRAQLKVVKDITGLQDANKSAFNEAVDKRSEFRRIARFDEDWLRAYGFDHGLPSGWYYQRDYMPLLMRIAHDPDYRDFRTMPGHFIRTS